MTIQPPQYPTGQMTPPPPQPPPPPKVHWAQRHWKLMAGAFAAATLLGALTNDFAPDEPEPQQRATATTTRLVSPPPPQTTASRSMDPEVMLALVMSTVTADDPATFAELCRGLDTFPPDVFRAMLGLNFTPNAYVAENYPGWSEEEFSDHAFEWFQENC